MIIRENESHPRLPGFLSRYDLRACRIHYISGRWALNQALNVNFCLDMCPDLPRLLVGLFVLFGRESKHPLSQPLTAKYAFSCESIVVRTIDNG